jgi:putative ABC transport system permease protein
MSLVALISAAGFVVVAQRRQRQLGLLAALGATERHLRLVVLANGVIVGLVSAVLGGALGVLGWMAAAPAVEVGVGHRLDRFALPWGLIAECLALAVVASTAAAWWPARTMAKMPVMSALSRRPARPASVHRSLALAALLVSAGVAGISTSHPTGDHVRPLVLIGSILALVIGTVLAAPAAIRVLAAPAARLPFTIRLALRDLARHQARASAALAAITLGLGISVAVLVIAGVNAPRADEGNLAATQVLITVGAVRPAGEPGLTDAERARFQAAEAARFDAQAAAVAAATGAPSVLPLDIAVPAHPGQDGNREPIRVALAIGEHSFRDDGMAYVATPQVLSRLGIDPAEVRPTSEILFSSERHPILLDLSGTQRDIGRATPGQRVALPSFSSAPRSLITEHAMAAHGWLSQRTAWFVQSNKPFTAEQISAARRAAATVGLRVEARTSQDGLATLRTASTAVGALLALAIVAMTIGLLRGESTRDLRTLTATGASGSARRSLTATTAGALALLGVVLATGGAYAAIAAAYHADLGRLTPIPLRHLLLLAVGLPVIATLGGWGLGGREPTTFARQSLE